MSNAWKGEFCQISWENVTVQCTAGIDAGKIVSMHNQFGKQCINSSRIDDIPKLFIDISFT